MLAKEAPFANNRRMAQFPDLVELAASIYPYGIPWFGELPALVNLVHGGRFFLFRPRCSSPARLSHCEVGGDVEKTSAYFLLIFRNGILGRASDSVTDIKFRPGDNSALYEIPKEEYKIR